LRSIDGAAFIYHGPYKSEEIVAKLKADDIHVGLHLSVWEETFSFTLSELAAAGVPVIAGDLGAQGERVRRCALGWTVPDPTDPGSTLKILDDILDTPQTLDDAVAAMQLGLALPRLETMWETYAGVYREVAPVPGGLMESEVELPDALVNRDYMLFLASRSSRDQTGDAQLREALESALAETAALRERLRSPRHRVADAAAGVLHRIPLVWPLVAKATDAWLSRRSKEPKN
jgi:hypothetical protein